MFTWFLLHRNRRNYLYSSNALRISLQWQYRGNYWPDDQFNMSNWGWIKWRMACSTQESCNQKCSRDFYCIAIVETIFTPAMHWEFHCNGNTEATTDQTINSTWAIEVGLSGGWPVPHKKAVIGNVHVISIASQSSKLSLLQQCIENFIAMAIPRQLLTRRSIQHEQLRLD